MKLIKLSDTHYIVVDDSEIKEGSKFAHYWYKDEFSNTIEDKTKIIISTATKDTNSKRNRNSYIGKITHSTQPLYTNDFWAIKELKLSEVKEAINGYSVEKMADEYSYFERKSKWGNIVRNAYVQGFNTHKELVKDKLFTVEDMRRAFLSGISITGEGYNAEYSDGNNPDIETEFGESANKFIQLLLPKTEWDVEFNEQGKLKLVE